MRQFRGLTKDGKWVYGWYQEFDGDSYIREGNILHCVIPETVGQYTGRKDKNSKEIYDNDSLRTPGGQILKVEIADLINGDGKFRSIPVEDCEIVGKLK